MPALPPTNPPPGAELLAHLVREARQEPPPPVDEARLERELFRRIDEEPAPEPARPAYWSLRFVVAGVAAAAAFAVASKREPPPSPLALRPLAPPPAVEAPTLTAHVAEAGDEPLAFARPGLASWTLEPHARATLVEDGDRVVLALERGALRVDVVPAPPPVRERFAVLVDGSRVSVRGTHFRVARSAERFDVDVTHGLVAVTPPHAPPERAWLLPGPRGGSFHVDGAEAARRRSLRRDGFRRAAPERNRDRAEPTRRAPRASRAPRAQAASHRGRPRELVAPRLAVPTTLRVDFRPDGRMGSLAFEPRLAPSVEACARRKIGAELGPAGAHELGLSLSGR
ncbi:MAG: FecR family protein [Polyangiaceae bacterium]|nr:FecR family protein [Polyangiaceae bacterium]